MNSSSLTNPGSNFGFKFKPKSEQLKDLVRAFAITSVMFGALLLASQAYAGNVTLSVVVNTSFSLNVATINNFSTITAGVPAYATTTLIVNTNDTAGWFVALSGDNKNATNNNLQSGVAPATSTQITDQTEWAATSSAATTTPQNAVLAGSFINAGNVLAFRVMSASSTNGAAFLSTNWWGTDDTFANAKWAGIPSTTASFPNGRTIGNSNSGYSSSAHINTVVYYLNVAATQPTGTYTAPITFTGAGN